MKPIYRGFAVATTLLLFHGLAMAQSKYSQFGHLNEDRVNVGSAWTKLNTGPRAHEFTKESDKTTIEVHVNSRFSVGELNGVGVLFQVRVDDRPTSLETEGSILRGNTTEFLSMLAVFRGLSAGRHHVSIWAQAPRGNATSVMVDPGGFGGKIIVKETQ